MEINNIVEVIKENSYNPNVVNEIMLNLSNEEKEELLKYLDDSNEKLKYELDNYREKIEKIRNKLYSDRKN